MEWYTIDGETFAALCIDAARAEEEFLAAIAAQDAAWAERSAPRRDVQPETVSDEEWYGIR